MSMIETNLFLWQKYSFSLMSVQMDFLQFTNESPFIVLFQCPQTTSSKALRLNFQCNFDVCLDRELKN